MKMPAARQHGTQVVQSEICAEFVGLELPRQSWTLTAISRRTFILEPAAIDFGQELRVNGPPISRAIVIHSAVPVRHVEVLNDTGALVVTSPTNDDSGCRFSFSCSISPDLLKQSCDFGTKLRLLITTDAVGDPVALEIPVRITVKHDVEAESPTSYLGTSPIGSIAEGNIHLNSFRAEPFRVESISGFPEAVAVVGTNLGRCDMDFTVRIKVEQLGAFRGEARFTVFDQFEAHAYTVVVPVIAIGTGK
jgi:hypothetical protein